MSRAGMRGVLAALLLVPGCGGERPAGRDALQDALAIVDAVDVCALLMADEIEMATGVAPGEPEPVFYEDATLCVWRRANDVTAELVSLGLMEFILDTYEEYLDNSEALLGFRATPEQAQLVEGPGHLAVWIPRAVGGTLHFFVDHHMLQIVAQPSEGRTALEASLMLGEVIYQRLP